MSITSDNLAKYILWRARGKPVTPMQLLKLAYISHGWMLGLYGEPLIDERAEAWRYGPVIPSIYHAYKKFGGNPITALPIAEPSGLSDRERNLIEQVVTLYGKYDGLQLSSLTHKADTPWDVTRRLSGDSAAISNELIREHYRGLATKNK